MSSAADDAPAPSRLTSGVFVRAPLPLVLVAAVVALTGLAMAFVGAGQTGLSADEYAHVKRLEAFYDDGLFVRSWERTTPEGTVPPNAYVYAPATTRVMHAVNQLAGHEGPGEVSASAEAFIVRHYVVAAMALAGTLATIGLAWLLLGSWRWGVVAAAALAAVPMWTGHAMFNPKDTPVAVGNTLMTLGLAGLAVAASRRDRARPAMLAATCIVTFLGIGLMLGTRPGMWPALAAAVVTLIFILAVGGQLNRWVVAGLVATLSASYVALWQLYPKVFGNPVAMVVTSMGQSQQFPHGVAPGRGYIVERTAIEWPILLLAFMLLGTVVGAIICVRLMRADPQRSVAYGLVGVQAYALTLAAIITGANVYDGLRQLLFAVPAQAVLVTAGIAVAIRAVERRHLAWTITGAAVAGLVLPTIVQARLFPYQYAYGNVVAEWAGAEILNDNWKVSFREYVKDIPPTIKAVCPNTPPAGPPIKHQNYSDCRGDSGALKPHWIAYWHHARYDPDARTFYTVLRAQRPVPPNCRVVDHVVRNRNLEPAVMSRLLLCTQVGVK